MNQHRDREEKVYQTQRLRGRVTGGFKFNPFSIPSAQSADSVAVQCQADFLQGKFWLVPERNELMFRSMFYQQRTELLMLSSNSKSRRCICVALLCSSVANKIDTDY